MHVYWIRHPDHTDIFSQGYVGVSVDIEKRFGQHYKRTQNRHLKSAIQKYGWDNLVKQQILVADVEYCLDIERKLRPSDDIGWNIVAGGGKPPVAYGNKIMLGKTPWNKGINLSKEHCENLSKSHMGNDPWNKGLKGAQVAWNKGMPMHKSATEAAIVKVSCIKCRKAGSLSGITRWHFNGCIGQRNHKARVTINGKRQSIGMFATKEEANQARINYLKEHA